MKSKDYEFKCIFKIKVIELIEKYIEIGATYREIADRLNKDKVETFSGRGKWYTQSVHTAINNREIKTP